MKNRILPVPYFVRAWEVMNRALKSSATFLKTGPNDLKLIEIIPPLYHQQSVNV